MTRPLEMRINLHALEHLGMKLYSTIPPVLSEVVANAWDADAERVDVCIDKEAGEISIQDDGTGMTRNEVIDRFLTVGFQRRAKTPETPKKKRSPMGRKGIGKLSSFSIARIVTVYTAQDGHRTAFRMDSEKMKEQMERGENDVYKPEELKNIEKWPGDPKSGTRIVLSDLKHKATQWTKKGLRQRIARRFSVIGPERNFIVTVDGERIETKDRGYYEHVEYLWTCGDQKETLSSFKNLAKNSEDRTREIAAEIARVKGGSDLSFSGWIGTVKAPGLLKAEDGENLNRLAVFMRGKLAQEDILTEFAQKELYAAYVVGEIHCDDLDRDDDEDIATSSRQSLKHADPRFGTVRDIVRKELRYIAGRWSDLRRRDGAKTFAREVPVVKEWLDALKGDTKKKAERWIGRLNVIRFGDSKKDDLFKKRELLKASILAFESYLRREQLDFLEKMDDYNIKTILDVFNDLDGLERSYYGQIVKLRLGAIKTLEEKLNDNEKEQAIRDCIFRSPVAARPILGARRGFGSEGKNHHEIPEKFDCALKQKRAAGQDRHRIQDGARPSCDRRVETGVGSYTGRCSGRTDQKVSQWCARADCQDGFSEMAARHHMSCWKASARMEGCWRRGGCQGYFEERGRSTAFLRPVAETLTACVR